MSLTINGLKATKNIIEKTIEEFTVYEYGYCVIMMDDLSGNQLDEFMVHICTIEIFKRDEFEKKLKERLKSFNYSHCHITGRLTDDLKEYYDIVVGLFDRKGLLVDSVYKNRK